ncbi:MAG: hypothetical protein IJL69_07395 [Oscillospiraceae bacterium]|nr:hypothetical protein [Oscillospiraceae bacterium]
MNAFRPAFGRFSAAPGKAPDHFAEKDGFFPGSCRPPRRGLTGARFGRIGSGALSPLTGAWRLAAAALRQSSFFVCAARKNPSNFFLTNASESYIIDDAQF